MVSQSTPRVSLIEVAAFAFNPQTAKSNRYQHNGVASDVIHKAAMQEWNGLKGLYDGHNIEISVFRNEDPDVPDAIYPNSVSTFPAGVLGDRPVAVLHPMLEENRRRERSPELVKFFEEQGYMINDSLLHHEQHGRALEGTGSVVMDHENKIAYCALSARSHADVAREYADLIGYELVVFDTHDAETGLPVYHTDLLLYIGSGYAGICGDCIVEKDRARVLESLSRHRDLVNLSMDQLHSYAGNAIEIENRKGEKYLAMSSRAFGSLSAEQKAIIESCGVKIIHTALDTIENTGGGSARCLSQEQNGFKPVLIV